MCVCVCEYMIEYKEHQKVIFVTKLTFSYEIKCNKLS